MTYSSWVAALAGTAMLATSLPASAQVVRFDPAMQMASPSVETVQFRGGARRLPGGGFHGGGFRGSNFGNRGFGNRGFGNRGFVYRGGYRGGRGAAIGAGVAGLAAGALIGGAIASQANPGYGYGYDGGYGGYPVYADPGYGYAAPPVDAAPPVQVGDASAYCAQRFKSYDAASGTYLGYDGQRHPCP